MTNRRAIIEKTRTLERMQQLLSQSKLTKRETLEIGRAIKRRMSNKYPRAHA